MESVELILKSCRSQETRNSYKISSQKYKDFIGENDLVKNNPRFVEAKIIEFIMSLRDQGKSYAAILNYLYAVKGFYKINDVMLDSHKINKFMPEPINLNKHRAYTHEEISNLLDVADEGCKLLPCCWLVAGYDYVEILTIEKSRLDRIEEKVLKMEQMYQK